MPFVSGFLRIRRRRPGGPVDPGYGVDEGLHPDHELPGMEGPVDPDYGIDEGDGGDVGVWPGGTPTHPIRIPLPRPPPGLWPGPTPGHPIVPVPPELLPPEVGGGPATPPGTPEHPIYRPGTIWPPVNATGKFIVVAWIPGQGWKYIVVDPSLKPTHPIELPPERQPK